MFDINKFKEIDKLLKKSQNSGKIVAISKNHPLESVLEAIKHGVNIFGENRVQEAQEKFSKIKSTNSKIELHLTGPLQSNKVKTAISLFDVFHTLDREKLANEFFKSANYLYPFGILVLKKIKKTTRENAEKEFFFDVDSLTKDYMSFMRQNGVINQSFFKGTFIGDDLNFYNEIRATIETTISETKKN